MQGTMLKLLVILIFMNVVRGYEEDENSDDFDIEDENEETPDDFGQEMTDFVPLDDDDEEYDMYEDPIDLDDIDTHLNEEQKIKTIDTPESQVVGTTSHNRPSSIKSDQKTKSAQPKENNDPVQTKEQKDLEIYKTYRPLSSEQNSTTNDKEPSQNISKWSNISLSHDTLTVPVRKNKTDEATYEIINNSNATANVNIAATTNNNANDSAKTLDTTNVNKTITTTETHIESAINLKTLGVSAVDEKNIKQQSVDPVLNRLLVNRHPVFKTYRANRLPLVPAVIQKKANFERSRIAGPPTLRRDQKLHRLALMKHLDILKSFGLQNKEKAIPPGQQYQDHKDLQGFSGGVEDWWRTQKSEQGFRSNKDIKKLLPQFPGVQDFSPRDEQLYTSWPNEQFTVPDTPTTSLADIAANKTAIACLLVSLMMVTILLIFFIGLCFSESPTKHDDFYDTELGYSTRSKCEEDDEDTYRPTKNEVP